MATDKKELWVGWTRDAAAQYERPQGLEEVDEVLDDMVDVTTGYADMMLEEFEQREERFTSTGSRRTPPKRRERREE